MKKMFLFISAFLSLIIFLTVTAFARSEDLKQALKKIKKEGCIYGLFMQNLPIRLVRINRFDNKIGKKPGMIMFFISWETSFPAMDMSNIIQYGAIPHIVWEPTAHRNGKEIIFLQNIVDGEWDDYLNRWAVQAKEFGYPFILRPGHEMDGNWYPWSGAKNGNRPELYVTMWRHIHDIFRKNGADNVIWAWTPINTNVVQEDWNAFYHYYPGDKYVDWIGMDGYNWGDTQDWSRWQSFVDLFNDRYYEMIQRYPGKPMMIGEFACAARGGNKPLWIRQTLDEIKKHYPAIKSFVWFNINKECDWRIHSGRDSLQSFSEAVKDDYFFSDAEKMPRYFKNIKFPENAIKDLQVLSADVWDKRPEMFIYRVDKKEPVIDGKIDEWPGGAFIHLNKSHIVLETTAWKGENDCSGRAAMLVSADALFIAFDVQDDHPFINREKQDRLWNGDSLEVAFNFDPEADPERTEMKKGDFQIAISLNREKPFVWCWQLKKEIAEAAVAVSPTEKGYICEARIPWDALKFSVKPRPGTRITVNFALNDADGHDRDCQMLWAGDQGFYKDPSVWGFADIELLP